MTIKDHLKKAIDDVTGTAKDDLAAHEEKSESDIEPDSHVAGSRAGGGDEKDADEKDADEKDGDEDGNYVGRTSPQFDSEAEESGAEARSEAARQAPETSGD